MILIVLCVLGLFFGSSAAARHTFYKIDEDEGNQSALRGKTRSRYRVLDFERGNDSNEHSKVEGRYDEENYIMTGTHRELLALSISKKKFLARVEESRQKTMEAMFEAEELLYTLRFSMSMSMPTVSPRNTYVY